MAAPNLYVIAGCNGAGKTTASFVVLPELLGCKEFVNADEIARGISPFNVEGVAITAGKVMLERINALIGEKVDFGFETTLSSRGTIRIIERAAQQGYTITLVLFWLRSPQIAVNRVAQRVSEGGHGLADETVIRRYFRGLDHFKSIYKTTMLNFWMIVDNSDLEFKVIAESEAGIERVHDLETFSIIMHANGK